MGETQRPESEDSVARREYTAEDVFKQGIGFFDAFALLSDSIQNQFQQARMTGMRQVRITTFPACFATGGFAAELLLKALLKSTRGIELPTHSIKELYSQLVEADQVLIREICEAQMADNPTNHVRLPGMPPPEISFARTLEFVDRAFVRWRYSYEYSGGRQTTGFGELVSAILECVVTRHPEWAPRGFKPYRRRGRAQGR